MRYTLDPEIENILLWRENQNIVLTLLLNEMVYVPEVHRRQLPYRMVIDPEKRMITDQMGRIVCEFSFLSDGVLLVDWIRSWQDFRNMEELGQQLRKERLYDKPIFTI